MLNLQHERDQLISHLASLEDEARRLRMSIVDQKRAIAGLRSMGADADEAERELYSLEQDQDRSLADIERTKDCLT